jgi:hypothetical protein
VHHHHPRAEHAKGGKIESVKHGDFAHDKAPSEVYAGKDSNVVHEAEAKKWGGRTKRKLGGAAKMAHMKHVGHVHGEHAHHHAGRKPRKSGGKVGADTHPLTSAHKGTQPKGRKFDMEKETD